MTDETPGHADDLKPTSPTSNQGRAAAPRERPLRAPSVQVQLLMKLIYGGDLDVPVRR